MAQGLKRAGKLDKVTKKIELADLNPEKLAWLLAATKSVSTTSEIAFRNGTAGPFQKSRFRKKPDIRVSRLGFSALLCVTERTPALLRRRAHERSVSIQRRRHRLAAQA